MGRVVRIIRNPVSGPCGRRGPARRLARRLREGGYAVELRETSRGGEATELARQCAPDAAAVIAAGGDGTVREVAAGLLGTPVPLVVYPAGTENLFARQFGYRADDESVAAALDAAARDAGRTISIDVALANRAPFLVVAGFGFDAEVVRRVHRRRGGHIRRLDYAAPIWRTFWAHRFGVLRVEADGERLCDEAALAFVGNLPRYALGLRLLRRARPDDGLLDVCVYRCGGRLPLLRHALNTALGRHERTAGVVYRQARRVVVSSPRPVPFELDGDEGGVVGGSVRGEVRGARDAGRGARDERRGAGCEGIEASRVEFTIRPAALRLLLPDAASGAAAGRGAALAMPSEPARSASKGS